MTTTAEIRKPAYTALKVAQKRLAAAEKRAAAGKGTVEDTENWKPVIDQINKLTDGNNHTEAVRALAMFALPDPTNKYRKMIDAAIALENAYGELPPGVDIIRKEVAIKALQALKGSPAYKPIRDAIGC